jgi:hypothetical protein
MRITQDRDDTGSGGPDQFGPGFATGSRRPWFGPKRLGFGYRPQTWQGWAVILIPVAVIILIAVLV